MQLFAKRGKFVKPGLEEQRWKEISYHFMTEESGGESSEEIVRHELPWRSESEFHSYSPLVHKYVAMLISTMYSHRCTEVHEKTRQETAAKPEEEGVLSRETQSSGHSINST